MKRTILIVEDESSIAETLQYALEAEAFETEWVVSGQQAIETLAAKEISLILLDVGLPDTNGFDLLRLIREDSNQPVIFLTARADEIDRIVGLEIGADDYVTKPFSPREVVARVKAILRRSGEPKAVSEEAASQHFSVDQQAALVHFQQQPLQLTKAEYLLLVALLERPGMVFSRQQLMNAIWQHPHPSDERTIDTHIKAVRAKLREIDTSVNPVRTHRGLGYSIES